MSINAAFWDPGFRGIELQRLNKIRKLYCLIHKSDLVACDGCTVMDDMFNRLEGKSVEYKFPIEQPESRDFSLWKRAIGFI